MTWQGWLQILLYVAVLTALTPLLGGYMARVYMGRRLVLERVLGPLERGFYRAVRTDPAREQDWKQYGRTVLVFSALFWLALYAILRLQRHLPFNPAALWRGAVERHLQHHPVVCHQHQLEVLRRRDDHVALVPDGGAGGAELRLGSGRHGGAGRRHPRVRPPRDQQAG